MGTFIAEKGKFILDGNEWRLISGAIHYFRVPREYWRDRLEKLVAMGCNAVETYIPWNLHEPEPGRFVFDGHLDIEAFLSLAHEMGLRAIVRPSPYICAELEFGGLPWWLLRDPQVRVRTTMPSFMDAVARYYRELLPRLADKLYSRDGPVIACQIENEYGYFGNDKEYLAAVRELLVGGGMDCFLFTTDGPWGNAMEAGSLDGVLSGGSFGSGAREHFAKMKARRPDDPLFCSEFWMGWFDAWGDAHHVREPADAAKSLDEILESGHVNLYMFHGGTNFGFTSGANHYDELKADITSYDYDAPLSESGDITPKYRAFRDVIAARTEDPDAKRRLAEPIETVSFSTKIAKKGFGAIPVDKSVSLVATLERISAVHKDKRALGMEELNQGYGYVMYRIYAPGPESAVRFALWKCNDRAVIYVDGKPVATRTGNEIALPLALDLPGSSNVVDVLVENQGRVNFGERMDDQRKGIYGGIIIDKHVHTGVESWPLPMDDISGIEWNAWYAPGTAAFHRAEFVHDAEEGVYRDSFLRLDGWGKGVAWINGFNLGRFWDLGPQKTLYVPGTLLKDGRNEIVIFESEGRSGSSVELADSHDLG